MRKGNCKLLIRNLRKISEQKSNVVEDTKLVARDEQGTPIIGEHDEKFCNCVKPWPSPFPDGKYYCLNCWSDINA
jgi:hypothetical protein